jgi:hypothetical protein
MSSGFVSGGTIDKPTERDDEWRLAQAELEAKRLEKEDRDKQHDGKSLFEVLQANKGDNTLIFWGDRERIKTNMLDPM